MKGRSTKQELMVTKAMMTSYIKSHPDHPHSYYGRQLREAMDENPRWARLHVNLLAAAHPYQWKGILGILDILNLTC